MYMYVRLGRGLQGLSNAELLLVRRHPKAGCLHGKICCYNFIWHVDWDEDWVEDNACYIGNASLA